MKHTFVIVLAALALAACRQEPASHMVGTLERDRVEIAVESNEPITANPLPAPRLLRVP